MPPMTRRTHSKSRHGCSNCKQRRVKCDETRPSCTNCVKRHTTCNYDSAAALVWKEANTPAKRSPSTSPKDQQNDIFNVFERITASQGTGIVSPAGEVVLDLELMMHWCNWTHEVLAHDETTAWIWRQIVPQEALSHPFLLWGILSLSALDLARSKDDEQRPIYRNAATYYQTRALTLFRPVLQDVNASNAKAVFAFAAIVAVYGFGSSDKLDMSDPIGDLYNAIMLIRGVNQVVACVAPTLEDSELAPLLHPDDGYADIPADTNAALTRLRGLNDSQLEGTESHAACDKAIESLEEMFSIFHAGTTSMTICGKWAIKVPHFFLECSRERQPVALIVLAHYCVLLHYLRRFWCLAPWATRVCKAIWDSLDEKGRDAMHWPMEQIFVQGFEKT